jgi:hypothetical protein
MLAVCGREHTERERPSFGVQVKFKRNEKGIDLRSRGPESNKSFLATATVISSRL